MDTDGKGENSTHSPKADDTEDAGRKNQQMIGLVFPGGDWNKDRGQSRDRLLGRLRKSRSTTTYVS